MSFGAITSGALARGLSYYRAARLSPADWVTLVRATLAVGDGTLVAAATFLPSTVTKGALWGR